LSRRRLAIAHDLGPAPLISRGPMTHEVLLSFRLKDLLQHSQGTLA
jgi:hypothetical protein